MAFFITLGVLVAAASTYLVHQFATRSLGGEPPAEGQADDAREHLRAA